jgi:hypothetical protein
MLLSPVGVRSEKGIAGDVQMLFYCMGSPHLSQHCITILHTASPFYTSSRSVHVLTKAKHFHHQGIYHGILKDYSHGYVMYSSLFVMLYIVSRISKCLILFHFVTVARQLNFYSLTPTPSLLSVCYPSHPYTFNILLH